MCTKYRWDWSNAVATGVDTAALEVTDAKPYVPVVTLSAEDNVKSSKTIKGKI